MNDIFGLSMTYIMIALLCLLALALSTVGWVLLRNRIMFLIGVRNIPRRRAQTTLIIIGLMLSTVIISTAFSIGDTVDYSISNTAYEQLHSIDEIVQAQSGDEGAIFEGDESLVTALPIEEERARELVARIRNIDGVDGAVSLVRGPVAVSNETKGQTEPLVILMAPAPDQLEGFTSDIVSTTTGDELSPDNLGRDEIYANESAADELDITPGDRLTLFVNNAPHEFTVKDIVEDRVLTGALAGISEGFVVGMQRAQELFGREAEVDLIAVSNEGGPREGLELSEEVTEELELVLLGSRYTADETKAQLVDDASEISSFVTTFFVVLGLFSIASGMLLVFLIFVMLAAERKVEMGMVRAVGTKRSHLVQIFLSEGMVYNVGAAAVGCALGILVSIGMVQIMAALFADFGLQISFHVTPRSLVVSYSIGVVLTFLTVTFSSWRIGNLNIVSAIRDTADPVTREPRPEWRGGIGGLARYVRWMLFKPAGWRQFGLAVGAIVVAALVIAGGVGLFYTVGPLYDTNAAGSVAAVLLAVFAGFAIAAAALVVLIALNAIFQTGPILVVAGPLLMWSGWAATDAFQFGLGASMLLIGLALVLRYVGLPARPVFTAMGVLILVFWLLFAGNNVPGVKELDGDIEMFFLSGVSMVIAATFILVYNADLLLALLTLSGGLLSSLTPSIKTAVAYPLANKFRTGMTVAMISLVMFALVMFSTMNENFDRIFLSDDALGGYEVVATENPGNPIDDLTAALEEAGGDTSGIAGVDKVAKANPSVASIGLVTAEQDDFDSYPIYGMSDDFIEGNDLTFQALAAGIDDEAALWESLKNNPDQAIIDAFSLPSGGFGDDGGFVLEGVEATARTFDPVKVVVRESATGRLKTVDVIGVLSIEASGLYNGLFLPSESFGEMFERPETTLHYVRLNDDADPSETARAIERSLLRQGVQAESLRKVIDEYQAQSRGFLYLFQAFMGIGLFVGIAAVGVIAFRTVVERRQQIGMLRAIGYTRRAIAVSFIMESSFTALLGIVSGIALGLLLANQLVQTDDFVAGGVDSFYIPWLQILAIGGFAFLASLVMTIIPSQQASRIPIAEALRYE